MTPDSFAALGVSLEHVKVGRDLFASLHIHVGDTSTEGKDKSRPEAYCVFKGLRSFDATDASFFIKLLPGPADENGLPESIRFWKTRIENHIVGQTFRVGVLYGPSGCGKSSLMKAGILPHLENSVVQIAIDATANNTEETLLHSLRKKCKFLPISPTLSSTLSKKENIPSGVKILVVVDQFEQWLNSHHRFENDPFVEALEQCDGDKVQCLLLVRDDFWTPLSRLFKRLNIELEGGRNINMVDLFDMGHSKRIMIIFGIGFGRIDYPNLSASQSRFLDTVVKALSQDGMRVVCVRLIVFIQMVKAMEWNAETLRNIGGMDGVGEAFLEEMFGAKTSPVPYRKHALAAAKVLEALLPKRETKTELYQTNDIKDGVRSLDELLQASGYQNKQTDFEELLSILNRELYLITPTFPGTEVDEKPPEDNPAQFYQLTHDYLVSSIREWLARKKKETKAGRAALMLAERTATWSICRESRQLPSLRQWVRIYQLTKRRKWTSAEAEMMAKANRHHFFGLSACIFVTILVISALAIIQYKVSQTLKDTKAAALVDSLLFADTGETPSIITNIISLRDWTEPKLRIKSESKGLTLKQKLHISLALLPFDTNQQSFIYERMLVAAPQEMPILREALLPTKEYFISNLWNVVQTPITGENMRRLRAASALAKYDSNSANWEPSGGMIVNDLLKTPSVDLYAWRELFRPVAATLVKPLIVVFHKANRGTVESSIATELLADYTSKKLELLVELILDADEKQFDIIFPHLKSFDTLAKPQLEGELLNPHSKSLSSSNEQLERSAQRRANAGVTLLKIGITNAVWPLLRQAPDPRARSYFIHRLTWLGPDFGVVYKRYSQEKDVSSRRAELLSIGEFIKRNGNTKELFQFIPTAKEAFTNDPDPGIHAAAEWLLRMSGEGEWLRTKSNEDAANDSKRTNLCEECKKAFSLVPQSREPRWYVNKQGNTMIVLPGPISYEQGSPQDESERYDIEALHKTRIGRSFAISAQSVTIAQFISFDQSYEKKIDKRYAKSLSCPANHLSWFVAAKYCNWVSEQEGIPESEWCYCITNGQLQLKEHYLHLSGYRLPTEAEMEYATRALSKTARFYGETEELLPEYGWYEQNAHDQTMPVNMLKPNDFGLFDVHGNVYTWCNDKFQKYEKLIGPNGIVDDIERDTFVSTTEKRILRGGAFYYRPSSVRSAYRYDIPPLDEDDAVGMRLARTLFSAEKVQDEANR